MDIATVGVATRISLNGRSGLVQDVRIALGAVAPTPIRALSAEQSLLGRVVDGDLIHEAARLASEEARPIDDIRGSAKHRQVIVEVLTRRTLSHALRIAQSRKPITFQEQRRLAVETDF